MNIRTLAIVIALFIAPVHQAQGQPNPVQVTADSFVLNEVAREATFTGNVVVSRNGLTLWADRVDVTYGAGGVEDIETFIATTNVRIRTDGQDATGARAVFDPANQLLTMTGDVSVTNAVGTLKGPQFVVDLKTNSTVFTGGSGGRVTGVFNPQ